MRGKQAADGDTRVAQNGYHYTKQDGHWRLTHHITAEKILLGRSLREDERVHFTDSKGKKDPTNPKYIQVVQKGSTSIRRRKAQLEARIDEALAEYNRIAAELKLPTKKLVDG